MSYEWVIIGGGIHGTHLAARLIGDANVCPEKLSIIDPAESLLHRWRKNTATTGMRHLRSASVHHLDLPPRGLGAFAKERRGAGLFRAPYQRPSLSLFNDHCEYVVAKYGLHKRHLRAEVMSIKPRCESIQVILSDGRSIESAKVVLALGNALEKSPPPFHQAKDSARIQHIFDEDEASWPNDNERVAVVGGGISAAQVALRLLGERDKVHLISRHEFREHQFDSSPGWLGPKLMSGFEKVHDFNRRREIIQKARHRGSLPPDLKRSLKRAIRKNDISHHLSEVESVNESAGEVELMLSKGESLRVDRVLLATGYSSARPGGRLVDELVRRAELPCADCAFPLVNSNLQWKHPSLFVTGALAELELGPAARNIAGARRAGDRIVKQAESAFLNHHLKE